MRKATKTFAMFLALAGVLASPQAVAQQYGAGGLLGRGNDRGEAASTGAQHQGIGDAQGGLFNRGFGGVQGDIINQTFNAPLGGGLAIMIAAGAGYVAIKSRNRKTNQKAEDKR